MIPSEKVIVAIDSDDSEVIKKLYTDLAETNVWVKIGMEAYYALGPKVILDAKDQGLKVFLDLKLHDIPNTVGQAMKALMKNPVDMVNVHAAGGSEMMKRAADTVYKSSHRPLLIAVTQLTSTSAEQMNREQRIKGDLLESVSHYAKLAQESGCDGVVSSPLEVQAIKLICGSRFLTVTPGIRPSSSDTQDQKRVTTPLEALKLGTDFMVIGRPVTEANNPKASLLSILKGDE